MSCQIPHFLWVSYSCAKKTAWICHIQTFVSWRHGWEICNWGFYSNINCDKTSESAAWLTQSSAPTSEAVQQSYIMLMVFAEVGLKSETPKPKFTSKLVQHYLNGRWAPSISWNFLFLSIFCRIYAIYSELISYGFHVHQCHSKSLERLYRW